MMNKINKTLGLLCLTLLLAIGIFRANALAHTMWLNVSDYSPSIGGNVIVYFGWGHRYPVHDFLDQERFLKNFYLINPKAEIKTLSPDPGGLLATKVNFLQEGTYIVVAELKPGFYTMWLENGEIHHKIGPKTGLSNVMVSNYYEQFAKAIVNVSCRNGNFQVVSGPSPDTFKAAGVAPAATLKLNASSGDSNFATPIGQKLEILPLKNPIDLKEGDYLPVRVLFEGKPLRSYPMVYATYSGFSTQDETYAYTTGVNGEGIAKIKIIRAGTWMIKVNYKILPTEEMKDKCNELSYTATLSFEVR